MKDDGKGLDDASQFDRVLYLGLSPTGGGLFRVAPDRVECLGGGQVEVVIVDIVRAAWKRYGAAALAHANVEEENDAGSFGFIDATRGLPFSPRQSNLVTGATARASENVQHAYFFGYARGLEFLDRQLAAAKEQLAERERSADEAAAGHEAIAEALKEGGAS